MPEFKAPDFISVKANLSIGVSYPNSKDISVTVFNGIKDLSFKQNHN